MCHIGFLSLFAPPSPSPSFQLSMVQILVIYTQTHKLHLQASMMLCLIICEFIPKIREKKCSEYARVRMLFILLFAISPCRMDARKKIFYQIKSNQVSIHRKQTIEFLLSITSSAAAPPPARTFADFCVGFFLPFFIIYAHIVSGTIFSLFNHRVNGEDKRRAIMVLLLT